MFRFCTILVAMETQREKESETERKSQQWLATALPECEFGFEHCLSLQSCSLSDEQVVVVSLERRFVNIKHLVPQVEGHAMQRGEGGVRSHFMEVWKEQSTSSHGVPKKKMKKKNQCKPYLPSDHLTMRALLSRVSFPSSSRLARHRIVFST